MKVKVTKKPKNTLEINIIVPVQKVKESYAEVMKDEVAKADLPGFRKGQAPLNLVEEKLNTSDLYGEVVNKVLQTYYPQALKENKIEPISNPKVEIKEFDLEKDFEFTATVATKPEIKIKEFRKDLKKAFEKKQKEHSEHDHETHLAAAEVIDIILEKTDLEVPEILVEEEIERMLVRLIDQAQVLGMSMEDFLKAQNKTTEQLRDEYKEGSEKSIKAEFALQHLIAEEKIQVTDQELEEAIAAVGDASVQEQMQTPMQKWYIRSVLAKNKLINELMEEAEIDAKTAKKEKK
ncbi:hypothetical protein HN803_00390 [candidate division WWE3 bacterium]|jgi:FKBP-type peptidyl-prolyl cis-trans isomerase (trigger factor)|nr:hypothetical protein [candidate division WWE3 bacterium]MBT7349243.1 hypothetical protein [candidate division WWE3 bacterium]